MAFLTTFFIWEPQKQIRRMERNVLHKRKISGKRQDESAPVPIAQSLLSDLLPNHELPFLGAKQKGLSWGSTQGAVSKRGFFPSFLEAWNPRSKNEVKTETAVCFFRLFCQMLCMFVTTKNNVTESFCLLQGKLLLKAAKDSVAFFRLAVILACLH